MKKNKKNIPQAQVFQPTKIPPKKKYLILIIVFLAGAIALTAYLVLKPKSDQKSAIACSTSLYEPQMKQMALSLATANYQQSAKLVGQIKSIPNYQDDPSCVYPILQYYINIGDPADSSLYLTKYEKVYKPGHKLNPAFQNVPDIPTLKSEVSSVSVNASSEKPTTFGVPK